MFVLQSSNYTNSVQGESLDVHVGVEQDGSTWRFVDASGLHANESILNNIDSADSVGLSAIKLSNLVGSLSSFRDSKCSITQSCSST